MRASPLAEDLEPDESTQQSTDSARDDDVFDALDSAMLNNNIREVQVTPETSGSVRAVTSQSRVVSPSAGSLDDSSSAPHTSPTMMAQKGTPSVPNVSPLVESSERVPHAPAVVSPVAKHAFANVALEAMAAAAQAKASAPLPSAPPPADPVASPVASRRVSISSIPSLEASPKLTSRRLGAPGPTPPPPQPTPPPPQPTPPPPRPTPPPPQPTPPPPQPTPPLIQPSPRQQLEGDSARSLIAELRQQTTALNAELDELAKGHGQRRSRKNIDPQQAASAANEAYDTAKKASMAASTAYQFAPIKPARSGAPNDDRRPSLIVEESEEDGALVRLLRRALLTKLIPVCRKLDITHIDELTEYDYEELAADMKQYANYTLLPNTWKKLRALVAQETATDLVQTAHGLLARAEQLNPPSMLAQRKQQERRGRSREGSRNMSRDRSMDRSGHRSLEMSRDRSLDRPRSLEMSRDASRDRTRPSTPDGGPVRSTPALNTEDSDTPLPSFAKGLVHVEKLFTPNIHEEEKRGGRFSALVSQCLTLLSLTPISSENTYEGDELRAEQLEDALAALATACGGVEAFALPSGASGARAVRVHLKGLHDKRTSSGDKPTGSTAEEASKANRSGQEGNEQTEAADEAPPSPELDLSNLPDRELQSDLSQAESEGMFSYLQLASTTFSAMSEDMLQVLASAMTILRFESAQTVVEKGEPGTWFGIVLSGSLIIEGSIPDQGAPPVLNRGQIIGELAIWSSEPQPRFATISGKDAGIIATMTMAKLCRLADDRPDVAARLVRILTFTCLTRQAKRMRMAREERISAAIADATNSVFRSPLKLSEVRNRAIQAPNAPIATAPACFRKLLRENGFDSSNVEMLCEAVQYLEAKEGDILIEMGTSWKHVFFLLHGKVRYDSWNYEISATDNEGKRRLCSVGTIALFGDHLLSDTSRVRVVGDTVLASISFEQIQKLCSSSPMFALRIMFYFGQSALRLSVALEWEQTADDPDERTEEPYVFSVPFDITRSSGGLFLFDPHATHGLDMSSDEAIIDSMESLYKYKLRRYRPDGSGLPGMVQFLREEVGVKEKEALFAALPTTNPLFEDFTDADFQALSEFMTVLRFEQEVSIVRRGEAGSWFGILLIGTLRVEVLSGDARSIRRGSIIGEMVPWQSQRHTRTATVKGHESGIIATMLVEELRMFAEQYHDTALKLMRLLVDSALKKQHENMRAARQMRLGNSPLFETPTNDEDIDPSAPAILRKLLGDKGFDDSEVDAIVDAVDYFEVKADDELLQAGQKWPYVVFLLRGSIRYDEWRYTTKTIVTDEDGHMTHKMRLVGTVAVFGTSLLSDTSVVRMSDDGTLAGLTFEQVRALCDDPVIELKLLYLLGQSAVDLSAQITESQTATDHSSTPLPGFDLDMLSMERIPDALVRAPSDKFYAERLLEQQKAAVRSETGRLIPGGNGSHMDSVLRSQVEHSQLMQRMTAQKIRVLEAENTAQKKSETSLKARLKKSKQAEKEATKLASKVLAPLEQLHDELSRKVKESPGEQARLAEVLNRTQTILDKHKYAFDWKTEVQRAEEVAGVSGDVEVSFWETVHKPSPMSAFVGASCGLGGLTFAEHAFNSWGHHYFHDLIQLDNLVLFSTSFGALCALLFGAPAAPLGSPTVTARGFALVLSIAVALRWSAFLLAYYTDVAVPMGVLQVIAPAAGLAATLAAGQQIHPPAIACSIAYMQGENLAQQWPTYLVAPVTVGVGYLLAVQLCVAKATRYATYMKAIKAAELAAKTEVDGVDTSGDGGETQVKPGKKGVKLGSATDASSAPQYVSSNRSRRRAAFANALASSRQQRRSSIGSDDGSASQYGSTWGSPTSSRAGSPPGSEYGDESESQYSSQCSSRVSSRAPSPPPQEQPRGASRLWQRARGAVPGLVNSPLNMV